MKSDDQIREELIAFLIEEIDDEDVEVAADTPLFSDGLIDSFAMAGLIAFVEDLAGRQIPHSEVVLENFDTVDRMLTYIKTGKSQA